MHMVAQLHLHCQPRPARLEFMARLVVQSTRRNRTGRSSVLSNRKRRCVQAVEAEPTTDLEVVTAERDKAAAHSKALQLELDEASSTLKYMEKLLKALKLHKKAGEAAQAALAQSQEECTAMCERLEAAQEGQQQFRDTMHAKDREVRLLQDAVMAQEQLQESHDRLLVRALVQNAIGVAKTRDAISARKEYDTLTKAHKRACKKLEDTQQELQSTATECASLQEQHEQALQALEQLQIASSEGTQKLELEAASGARLTQRLEREKAAVEAARADLDRVRAGHEKVLTALESGGSQLQTTYAPSSPQPDVNPFHAETS